MAKTKTDSIEEDLTCSLCQDLFTNPKDLDCPHVFCLQCLGDWVKAKTDSTGEPDGIVCPECRQKTLIPDEGISTLRTNIRLRSLAEKYASRKANILLCNDHDEMKHFFCETCRVSACHVCLKLKHEVFKHKVKGLTEVSKEWKDQMKVTLTNVREDIEKQKRKLRTVSKGNTVKVQKATGLSLIQIKKRVQEMVIDIQRRGDILQAQVQKMEKNCIQMITTENDRIEKEAQLIHNDIEALEMSLQNIPDHEYVAKHAELMDKISKLRISERNIIPDLNIEDFHFHPGPMVSASVFGRLPTKICKATLVEEIGQGIFKKAQGIASNRTGILAIADTDNNRVCVYQRKSETGKYEFSFWLCAEDMTGMVHRPFDVAVTSCGTMYVTSDRQIKVFSSTGQFEKAFLTLNSGPSRITSTSKNQILVSDDRKKVLTCHSSSGEVVSKYPITNTAINLATNDKLVAFTNQSHGNVCVIDLQTGEERLNFQVGVGEATTGVCFVDSCNSILVSVGRLGDTGNDRIEQYCCVSGRLIACALTGLFAPMCLTMLNEYELAVADVGRVQIYKLQFSD
ncbi:uncharacterized protein [Amphiura filiformis]|uniref:uncharacterized protein n=1 Tax=Amphiura filiformis TaxID=82378 RepID=UPI003B226620